MKLITHQTVQNWLNQYVEAWKTYDLSQIGPLFSEDARYFYGPFQEPVEGRKAIVESWLGDNADDLGTYDAAYYPIAIEGNVAVTNGQTYYFEADGKTVERVFDNIFVIHFNESGQCVEFREWYMKKQ